MRSFRLLIVVFLVLLFSTAVPVFATPLEPFIDLQEAGLNLVADGAGTVEWGGGPVTMTVNVGGPVRFALLYWAGSERPCIQTSPGICSQSPSQPYKDQQVVFEGVDLTGTVIGVEAQPLPSDVPTPTLHIGYFADVTSIVMAKGLGTQSFTFTDGNPASNLTRLDGVALMVGYTNVSDPTSYRVLIQDGLDFVYGADPTPGETRTAAPVTFNHGVSAASRVGELYLIGGGGTPSRPDQVSISNNASRVNTFDADEGAAWDVDFSTLTIPANEGTTTVQVLSAPENQNPDELLWIVAALRVTPTMPTGITIGKLTASMPSAPIWSILGVLVAAALIGRRFQGWRGAR